MQSFLEVLKTFKFVAILGGKTCELNQASSHKFLNLRHNSERVDHVISGTGRPLACEQAHIWGHTRERQRANIKWRGDSAERSLVGRRE